MEVHPARPLWRPSREKKRGASERGVRPRILFCSSYGSGRERARSRLTDCMYIVQVGSYRM